MNTRRARTFRTLVAAALILSAPLVAEAQGPVHDDPVLASVSDVIVTGRVTGIAAGRDARGGFIYTYVTVAIDERIKGAGIGDEVVIKQLGGRMGDTGMMVFDQATFQLGEEVLLFLVERPRDLTLQTTALWQGKWNVARRTGGDALAVRTPFGALDRQSPVERRSFEDARPLEPFLAELRSWSRPADGAIRRTFITHPPEAPAVSVSGADPRPAFELLGPARWNEPDTLTPVLVDVQASGEPGLTGGGFNEIDTARGIWNRAGSSMGLIGGDRVLSGATAEATCAAVERGNTGRVTVVFEDPCDEIANDDTIAVGGFFFVRNGGVTVNGTAFDRITAGFLINSDEAGVQDVLDVSRCFQDVQTHELGHVIGLGHTSVPGSLMLPNIDNACRSAGNVVEAAITGGLGPDDIEAINFVYPLPGELTSDPNVAPGRPRALTATLESDRVVLEWLPPSSGGPVISYHILGGSEPGRNNYANFDTFQAATKINLKIRDGEYYIRVLAKNNGGRSDPSNEVNFVVSGNGDEPDPVFVQPTLNFTEDASGDMLVMGEIQNRFIGPGPPTFIEVEATFIGPGGAIVGTDSAFILGRSRRLRDSGEITDTALAAGQRGCFMIRTNIPAARVSQVELTGSFSTFSNDALDGQLRVGQRIKGANASGNFQVQGSASNIGSRRTFFNRVVVDVKTPQVQSCDFTFVQGSNVALPGGGSTSTGLAPGASGTFVSNTSVPFGRLAVRLYTQWDEADPNGSGAVVRQLAGTDADAASALAEIITDRSQLWQLLVGGAGPSPVAVHRLRNGIEARLRALEARLAPTGGARTLPFSERLRFSIRHR